MASTTADVRSAVVSVTGHALVRRFTDEQNETTTLGRATKAAQEEDDVIFEEQQRERLSSFYKNLNGDRK